MAARKSRQGRFGKERMPSENRPNVGLDVVSYLDLGLHSLMVVDTEVWVDRIVSPEWSCSLPIVSNAVLFCGVSL